MTNILIWLAVGAVVGCVAGVLMRGEEDGGVFLNVAVGIVGALAAGWFAAPLVGVHFANARVFALGAVGVALLGAIVLLCLIAFVRGKRASR